MTSYKNIRLKNHTSKKDDTHVQASSRSECYEFFPRTKLTHRLDHPIYALNIYSRNRKFIWRCLLEYYQSSYVINVCLISHCICLFHGYPFVVMYKPKFPPYTSPIVIANSRLALLFNQGTQIQLCIVTKTIPKHQIIPFPAIDKAFTWCKSCLCYHTNVARILAVPLVIRTWTNSALVMKRYIRKAL